MGPDISPTTVSEAEKLVQVKMADSEVAVAASSWRRNMAALYERRTGPRKVELEATLAPATKWNPVLAESSGRGMGASEAIRALPVNAPALLPLTLEGLLSVELSRWSIGQHSFPIWASLKCLVW